jgi:hypothetical protein
MAFDDVLSRTALAIERRSIAEKITSSDLTELYRSDKPLADDTIRLINHAIRTLANAKESDAPTMKFNKATAFSWLIFLTRGALSGVNFSGASSLAGFLTFFRSNQATAFREPHPSRRIAGQAPLDWLFAMYENRSTARVADVSSVILRDAVLWILFEDFSASSMDTHSPLALEKIHQALGGHLVPEDDIFARRLIETGWGVLR